MDNEQTKGSDKNYLKSPEEEIFQTKINFIPQCLKDHILKMRISE